VLGTTRTVYEWCGAPPYDVNQQGGLTLNTTGLLEPDNYTIELLFQYFSNTGWRKITDHRNRTADGGFYISPEHRLDVYPITRTLVTTALYPSNWYRVVLSCFVNYRTTKDRSASEHKCSFFLDTS
jgi:hypothetical protein